MGIEQLFDKYGFWALLLYVILDKGAVLINKYLPFINGQQMKKLEMQEDQTKREYELEERQVVAMEQIGKALVLISERLDSVEEGQKTMMSALNETNQSLAVLVDRETVRKKTNSDK